MKKKIKRSIQKVITDLDCLNPNYKIRWIIWISYKIFFFFLVKRKHTYGTQKRNCFLISHWQYMGVLELNVEKAMAPHSSTLAWKIPWTEEPGRLQSMGSRRVRHDWVTSLALFTFMHWRRKWQPTPVFLPGESQGSGSLVGCRLWGRTESDTTEAT